MEYFETLASACQHSLLWPRFENSFYSYCEKSQSSVVSARMWEVEKWFTYLLCTHKFFFSPKNTISTNIHIDTHYLMVHT